MSIRAAQRDVVPMEPTYRVELGLVEPQFSRSVSSQDVPDGDVGVTSRFPDSLSDGQEEGFVNEKLGIDGQLFLCFPQRCRSRVLPGFYVPTGRQPQLSVDVIYKQDVLTINEGEVGDQMLGRNGRFFQATYLGPRFDPRKDVFFRLPLQRVQRFDLFDLFQNLFAHQFVL